MSGNIAQNFACIDSCQFAIFRRFMKMTPEQKAFAKQFASAGGRARAKLANIYDIRSAASNKAWLVRHEDTRRAALGLRKMTKAEKAAFHASKEK